MEEFTTLRGFTQDEVIERLTTDLEPAAYKPLPGAAGLTDINPPYLWETMTDLFGLCGIGWWLTPPTENNTYSEKRYRADGSEYDTWVSEWEGFLCYRYVAPWGGDAEWSTGDQFVHISNPIPCDGESVNQNKGFARRGAKTSAIGSAARLLLWQLKVYKGQYSAAPAEVEPIKTAEEARAVVVPFRKHKGKTVGEVFDTDPDYFSGFILTDRFEANTDIARRVVEAAQFLIGMTDAKEEKATGPTFALGENTGAMANDAQKSRVHDLVVALHGLRDKREDVDYVLKRNKHPVIADLHAEYAKSLIIRLQEALDQKKEKAAAEQETEQ